MTKGNHLERDKHTLFTPGPVMVGKDTRSIGSGQMVYHRTNEFSKRILRCERMLKNVCEARHGDHVIMITGSGTAAMEAAVINLFQQGDALLVVNGGDFGKRFSDIARLHYLNVAEVKLQHGRQIRHEDLLRHARTRLAGVLVNHHETTTGNLLDLRMIARFCRERDTMLVVDAIGSFLADPISMSTHGIDALIISSQKGLALPPGLSFVIVSRRAMNIVHKVKCCSYYLNFQRYLKDIERGQTPFTPAVGLVQQLEHRLQEIVKRGVKHSIESVRNLAVDFRNRMEGLPLKMFAESPSNAITALEPVDGTLPEHYINALAQEFGLFVCPNGGILGKRIFRVGHIGALSVKDNQKLIKALRTIVERRFDKSDRSSNSTLRIRKE